MANLTSIAGLARHIQTQREWLVTDSETSFPVLSEEITVFKTISGAAVSLVDRDGLVTREFSEITLRENDVRLEGPEGRLTLTPRTNADEFRHAIEDSRVEETNRIAERLRKQFPKLNPLRVSLNETNGRFAEIIARNGLHEVAVLADVTGIVSPEALLTRAMIWLENLKSRKKNRVRKVWLIVEDDRLHQVEAVLSVLQPKKRSGVVLFRYLRQTSENEFFRRVEVRAVEAFWESKRVARNLPDCGSDSESARAIEAESPEAIDVVTNRSGESIRFNGLLFARVRQFKNQEKMWFGVERPRTLLEPDTEEQFERLLRNLKTYRSFDSENKQHELYRLAPEAWLESMLRRRISVIDRNLILSPIYNQFRASREKIDLLALRNDGRLVVIELKVNQDREMVFQALDYWRRIEGLRRNGSLEDMNLFEGRPIQSAPALVYLVAPKLGFHKDTDYFARMADCRAEIYRFELCENWRNEIIVDRRVEL